MDFPTEFDIDSILSDIDGPKRSMSIKSNHTVHCLTDDHKLLDDLIAHLDDESFTPLQSYKAINASSQIKTCKPKYSRNR